jgi:hypothetical protein
MAESPKSRISEEQQEAMAAGADSGARVQLATSGIEPVPAAPRRPIYAAAIFVWAVWAVVFVAILQYAAVYSINIPWADEWSHANVIAGERPASMSWLWEQHNEHRVAVPKLLWLASLQLSGDNFHLLPLIDTSALGGLAFGLILAAMRLRGRIAYTDALLPLVILTPAQYDNLVWAWQVEFVLPVVLAGVLLLRIVRHATRGVQESWKGAAAIATCLAILPFCAAVGLAFGAAMSFWAGYLAFRHWRSNELSQRPKAWLFLAAGVFCLAMPFFYFHGLAKAPQIPGSPGLGASLITSLEFLSGAFGMNAGVYAWPIFGLAVLALIGVSALACLNAWRRRDLEPSAAAGLLLLLTATLGLAFAIGHGRSGFGKWSGLAPRYVTLMIPGVCAIYFTSLICASRILRQSLLGTLLAILCLAVPTSIREALTWGRARIGMMQAFEKDLRAGSPPWLLAEQYQGFIAQPPEVIAEAIPVLHRAGIGLFRAVKNGPPVSLVALPVSPGAPLSFQFSRPVFVAAIRLKCKSTPNACGPRDILFRRSAQNGSPALEQRSHLEHGSNPADQALLAVINESINEIRIDPDNRIPPSQPFDLGLLVRRKDAARGSPSAFSGNVDIVSDGQVAGWVSDRQHPDSRVPVEVYDGDTQIAAIPARQFRKDLRDHAIGNGEHGFSYPSVWQDGKVHVIHVLVAGANTELTGSPKAVLATKGAVSTKEAEREPGQAPSASNVEGSFDVADLNKIAGWVWDKSRPDVPIAVDVRDGDKLLSTVRADVFRQDLLAANKGNGAHSFSYELHFEATNGAVHTIRVFASGTNVELPGSPKTVTAKR